MSTCIPSATATQSTVVTSDIISTSFSSSVTSAPYLTSSTEVQGTCTSFASNSSSCLGYATSTSATTLFSTVTTTVPVEYTVSTGRVTQYTTQYGTVCTDVPPSQDPTSDTIVVITTTPPPSTVTQSQSSTMSDGQVTVQYTTVTTTPAAVTTSAIASSSSSSSSSNVGAIVGGTVGGVIALLALLALLYYLYKKRQSRWDDIFNDDDDNVIAHTGNNANEAKPFMAGNENGLGPSAGGAQPNMMQHGSSANMMMQHGQGGSPSGSSANMMQAGGSMHSGGSPNMMTNMGYQPDITRPGDYGMAGMQPGGMSPLMLPVGAAAAGTAAARRESRASGYYPHSSPSDSPVSMPSNMPHMPQSHSHTSPATSDNASGSGVAGAAGYFGHPRFVVANQNQDGVGEGIPEEGAEHWRKSGEKAGLVHLDGGRAQRDLDQENGDSGPSQQPDAPPPAYSAD